jgi:thiol-disulfide isomerase/thioredoxin
VIRRLALAAIVTALALPGMAHAQVTPPRLQVKSVNDLRRPLPAPYDSTRDARRDVEDALALAKQSGKLLLVDFGANWCADCRVLAGILDLPEMRGWVADHYVVVPVDIGRFDRNLDLPIMFGGKALTAVPAVLIVDPATGRIRNAKDIMGLGDARIMRPKEVAAWLAHWPK